MSDMFKPDGPGKLSIDEGAFERYREMASHFDAKLQPDNEVFFAATQVVAGIGHRSLHYVDDPERYSVTMDVTRDPVFDRLPSGRQASALIGDRVLSLVSLNGYAALSKVRRAVDFGAGGGGPTLALAQLAKHYGTVVEAIEQFEPGAQQIVEYGILERSRVRVCDGIVYLGGEEARGQYDLITSFMLGPDVHGTLARQLLDVSRNALQPGGRLIICSDPASMLAARQVCDKAGVAYSYIDALPDPSAPIPGTLVIGFDGQSTLDLSQYID